MKKIVCLAMLLAIGMNLCACGWLGGEVKHLLNRNHVEEETKASEEGGVQMETILWGSPTLAKPMLDTDYMANVEKIESGEYLFRLIDTKGMYYESGMIPFQEGYSVRIYVEGTGAILGVTDPEGTVVSESPVFSAAL